MKESVCIFGAQRTLTGVLTEPSPELVRHGAPALIFMNAGLLHRVGPNRSSVTLARRLATLGYASLRFDQGGLGDSELVRRRGSDAERAVLDLLEACDFLESHNGLGRFVVVGLCSGADGAHLAAVRDSRIVGIVQLDGYGYRTLRYHLDLLATRLRRPSSWKTLLRLLFLRPPATARREDIFVRDFAPRLEVEAEIQALVDSGTELLYVYTSGVAHYYRYRKQFVDMFPNLDSRGRIAVEFFPLADHTYVFPEDRERLFEAVTGWLTSREWSADTGVDRARLP